VRLQFQQPFVGQLQERIPNRASTNPESICQIRLAEPFACRQVAGQHIAAKMCGNLLPQAADDSLGPPGPRWLAWHSFPLYLHSRLMVKKHFYLDFSLFFNNHLAYTYSGRIVDCQQLTFSHLLFRPFSSP
jgi:hypothetical protein